MRLIEQIDDWHLFRSKGLGSSDAPVVMKVSPFKTRFELWREKAEGVSLEAATYPMQRGIRLEPMARAQYEAKRRVKAPPALFIHDEYSFIRASLDGWISQERKILEIKCPGKVDHQIAKEGAVPQKYFPQLQHLLFTTGAESLDYFSFDGQSGVMLTVLPDPEYMARLLSEELAFWKLVETKVPPPMTAKDIFNEHPIKRKWRELKRASLASS